MELVLIALAFIVALNIVLFIRAVSRERRYQRVVQRRLQDIRDSMGSADAGDR